MAETGPLVLRDVEQELIQRAITDEAFAAKLKANPKQALQEQLTGKGMTASLPASLQVKVVEETPDTIYLVLPPTRSGGKSAELSDQQLELVSGGGYRDHFNTTCTFSEMAGEPNYCS